MKEYSPIKVAGGGYIAKPKKFRERHPYVTGVGIGLGAVAARKFYKGPIKSMRDPLYRAGATFNTFEKLHPVTGPVTRAASSTKEAAINSTLVKLARKQIQKVKDGLESINNRYGFEARQTRRRAMADQQSALADYYRRRSYGQEGFMPIVPRTPGGPPGLYPKDSTWWGYNPRIWSKSRRKAARKASREKRPAKMRYQQNLGELPYYKANKWESSWSQGLKKRKKAKNKTRGKN